MVDGVTRTVGLAGISYCLMWILVMWWRPNFAWLSGTTVVLVLDPLSSHHSWSWPRDIHTVELLYNAIIFLQKTHKIHSIAHPWGRGTEYLFEFIVWSMSSFCYCHATDKADSRFAPCQWETVLLCNDVSHWLGASLEWDLCYMLHCIPCLWGSTVLTNERIWDEKEVSK